MNWLRFILITILITLYPLVIHAQKNNKASEKSYKKVIESIEILLFTNLDSALGKAQLLEKMVQNVADSSSKAQIYESIADVYLGANNSIKAIDFFKCAIDHFENQTDIFQCKLKLGQCYLNLGKRKEAYQEFNTVLVQSPDFSKNKANSFNKIGAWYASQSKFSDAEKMFKESLVIRNKLGDVFDISSIHYNLGNLYRLMGKLESSLEQLLIAKKMREKINHIYGLADVDNLIGNVYFSLSNYDVSYQYYLNALKVKEKINDKKAISKINTNIGAIFISNRDFKKAKEYLIKAEEILEESQQVSDLMMVYVNLAVVYRNLEDYAKAYDYYLKAERIARQIGNKKELVIIYTNLSYLTTFIDEGLQKLYVDKAIKTAEEIDDAESLVIAYIENGDYELRTLNYTNAYKNYRLAEEKAENIENKKLKHTLLIKLIGVLENLNNYSEAFRYFKLFKAIDDSIYSLEKSKLIATIERKFSIEKKDQELKLVNNQNELLLKSFMIGQLKSGEQQKNLALLDQANRIKELEIVEKQVQLYQQNEQLIKQVAQVKVLEKNKVEIGQQLEISAKTIHQSRMAILVSLFILMLISLLSVLLYRSNKKRKKVNQTLSENKAELEQKNLSITQSINYAKKIQETILPNISILKPYLKSYSFFYKPKDIVSGDFYWIEEKNDYLFAAVVDCTGHGVPGAFISLIGYNCINRALQEDESNDPGKILSKTHNLLVNTLKEGSEHGSTITDGMDVCLIAFDKKNKKLYFSGANRPIYIIRNKEIIEYKPTKKGIGGINSEDDQIRKYKTEELPIIKNDCVVMFTDGIVDQFGKNGKKLMSRGFKNLLLSLDDIDLNKHPELMENELKRWMDKEEQTDDILVVSFKI